MTPNPVQFLLVGRGNPALFRVQACRDSAITQLMRALDSREYRAETSSIVFPIHPAMGQLRMPLPQFDEWLPYTESAWDDALTVCEAVILSEPRLCTPTVIENLLTAGHHVLCDYLPSVDAEVIYRLYETAGANNVQFHLSCVSLYHGVPLTMGARIFPMSVASINLMYKGSGASPDDISELLYRNIATLVHLVSLSDTITTIESVAYQQGVLTADLRTTHGAHIALEMSQAPIPEMIMDFTITDHANTWRQLNDALYLGRSPQTILQGMNVYQDDLARFTRSIRTGNIPHPNREIWIDALDLAEALTQQTPGPLLNKTRP